METRRSARIREKTYFDDTGTSKNEQIEEVGCSKWFTITNNEDTFTGTNIDDLKCDLSSDSDNDENSTETPKPKKTDVQNNSEKNADFSNESGFQEGDVTDYYDFTSILSQNEQVSPKKESNKLPPQNKNSSKELKRVSENLRNELVNVSELLALGESTKLLPKQYNNPILNTSVEKHETPKQVEILVKVPESLKVKKPADLEQALKRRLNMIKQEKQVYIHKVSILCWIAHGNFLNNLINEVELLSVALSLLPSDKSYPKKHTDLNYLEEMVKWFKKKVILDKEFDSQIKYIVPTVDSLKLQFRDLKASNKSNWVFMFICVLRSLGIKSRLIINLNVAPKKLDKTDLLPVTVKPVENKTSATVKTSVENEKSADLENQKDFDLKNEVKKSFKSTKLSDREESSSYFRDTPESKKSDTVSKRSKVSKQVESKNVKLREEKLKTSRRSLRTKKCAGENSKYFEEINTSDESDNTYEEKGSGKQSPKKINSKRRNAKESNNKSKKKRTDDMSDNSDSDFITPVKKVIDRRVLSSEDEEETKTKPVSKKVDKKDTNNYWVEVFLEEEESWICVDVPKGNYLCPEQLYNNASHPVRYVIAWNTDNTIKDVTRRYVPNWLTHTRKLRVNDDWWEQTIRPYKPMNTAREREEDEELDQKDIDQPLPVSVSEYKNHPLYVLKRHLLKFQALYPPDTKIVGHVKGEEVYPRSSVHHLHGREMWIKEAKVVKQGETPYKIVKGRPKRDKFGSEVSERKDIELFGKWQVEDYVPPVAKDGIVPRNAFGNVDLFQMCMLPKGTCYLPVPGLLRVANKLQIDCAGAITGFEFKNGFSYPVKDGFVVCEEFVDILLDAYNQEIEEMDKRERLKRRERAVNNWKKLVKLIRIQKKLKRKYNFQMEDITNPKPNVKRKPTIKNSKTGAKK